MSSRRPSELSESTASRNVPIYEPMHACMHLEAFVALEALESTASRNLPIYEEGGLGGGGAVRFLKTLRTVRMPLSC